jgi:hypothetical protein
MELTMPGPKAKSQTCFAHIYTEVTRLFTISENAQQIAVLRNLRKGLETIEPLWHEPLKEPHSYSIRSQAKKSLPYTEELAYRLGVEARRADMATGSRSQPPNNMLANDAHLWKMGYASSHIDT